MLPTKVLYLIMKEAIPNSLTGYKKMYKTRLKTQKFIYLFDQIWGGEFYDHSWYLAGPYSSTLTRQIYDDLLPSLKEDSPEWDGLRLSDDTMATIERVKTLISKVQKEAGENLSETGAYELVASIWYLAGKKKGRDTETIKQELLLNKPHFNDVDDLDEIIHLVTDEMNG